MKVHPLLIGAPLYMLVIIYGLDSIFDSLARKPVNHANQPQPLPAAKEWYRPAAAVIVLAALSAIFLTLYLLLNEVPEMNVPAALAMLVLYGGYAFKWVRRMIRGCPLAPPRKT